MSKRRIDSGPGGRPGGLFLAMDTSGREGSVALGALPREEGSDTGPGPPGGEGGAGREVEILGEATLSADEEHAALLIPRVQGLLREAGTELGELEGIVVGAGPGSFTGVRVGAATAKGLARALTVPLWAYSSLAGASAHGDQDAGRSRGVLFDARSDRLYLGVFRVGASTFDVLVEPTAATLSDVVEGIMPPGAVLMGDGAVRHREALEEKGWDVLPPPAGLPSARGLLRLLSLDPTSGPLDDPGRWEPDYLRKSGAERMWKTRREWKS